MANRKKLEENLKQALSAAENEVAKDPQLKSMIDQMRRMYHENSDDFMFAMGLSNSSSAAVKPNLPQSRIPHLIFLLDSISKRSMNLPEWKRSVNFDPPSLSSSLQLPKSVNGNRASPKNKNSLTEKDLLEKRTQLRRYQMELDSLEQQYEALKQEQAAIQKRNGKYAVPTERLKAERLLREIPGKITQIAQQMKIIQEQLNQRRSGKK